MECKFVVGQRVVCVARGDWAGARSMYARAGYLDYAVPERGKVYTIREIYVAEGDDAIGLRFKEIVNPPLPGHGQEPGFMYQEFAPLEERKTDISIFTKMLGPELVS